MNKKAQGALEYLLLIGGAVIVAAVVLTLITGLTSTGQQAALSRATDVLCAPFSQIDCGDKYTDPDGAGPLPATLTSTGKDPDGTGSLGSNACKWQTGKCVPCNNYNAATNVCLD